MEELKLCLSQKTLFFALKILKKCKKARKEERKKQPKETKEKKIFTKLRKPLLEME